jgi:hypothetical protein
MAYSTGFAANAACDVIDEHGEAAFATLAAAVHKLLPPT